MAERSGRRREWLRPADDTEVFPAVVDEEADPGESATPDRRAQIRTRAQRFGQAVVAFVPGWRAAR